MEEPHKASPRHDSINESPRNGPKGKNERRETKGEEPDKVNVSFKVEEEPENESII